MTDQYRKWLQTEAALIKSDGCTAVAQWALPCCWEHDLAYFYGKCPREAFEVGWTEAARIGRLAADWRYLCCNPAYLKHRGIAVMFLGRRAWKKHRKERP